MPNVVLKITARFRWPACAHLLLLLFAAGRIGASPPSEAEYAALPNLIQNARCYYYESPGAMRWRMYEALRRGASDVGICTSNMLTPSPENVTFLRCLYAEELALEPVLAASAPAKAALCDDPNVTMWEREQGSVRYVIVQGNGKAAKIGERFTVKLPSSLNVVDVLFEGRTLKPAGPSFSDVLEAATAVHVYRVGK